MLLSIGRKIEALVVVVVARSERVMVVVVECWSKERGAGGSGGSSCSGKREGIVEVVVEC